MSRRAGIAYSVLLLLLGNSWACDFHPPEWRHSAVKNADSGFRIGPAISGSWFDPSRSGEGLVIEFLPDGKPLLFWFTYPPRGSSEAQAWMIAQDGIVDGARVRFPEVLRPVAGRFGAAFDPAQVRRERWGSMELEFDSCGRLRMQYSGPAEWGSGARELQRLTNIEGLDCNGGRTLTASGAPALAALRARSGAWYDLARSGEGWIVEELPGGETLAYWFTYTPTGAQAWMLGQGTRSGDQVAMRSVLMPTGTRFGSDFVASEVQRTAWGELNLRFPSCDRLELSYAALDPSYGSASRNTVRLTALGGAACVDAAPGSAANARWIEKARMPVPWPSELAVTVIGDQLYALGGFDDRTGVRRYDPLRDAWTALPALPSGRDHLAAYGLDGALYMTGGAVEFGEDPIAAGFRFDATNQRWLPVPELLPSFGSHAAVLNGKAYIGNADGSLIEHDARQQRVRVIPGDGLGARDHSQVVAFMGEIWMLAGRSPETTRVAIWDPVRERWRNGPPLNRVRGGFAAAVVGARIVVAGGEVFGDLRARLEGSAEVYNAGAERWELIANLPVPVHGTAAGTVGGQLHVISGSTLAGAPFGANGRVWALELPP